MGVKRVPGGSGHPKAPKAYKSSPKITSYPEAKASPSSGTGAAKGFRGAPLIKPQRVGKGGGGDVYPKAYGGGKTFVKGSKTRRVKGGGANVGGGATS
jgi:hypothetical protein